MEYDTSGYLLAGLFKWNFEQTVVEPSDASRTTWKLCFKEYLPWES